MTTLVDKLERAYKPEGELPPGEIRHRPFGLGAILRGRSFEQLSTEEKLGLMNNPNEKVREWARSHRMR